MPFTDYPNYVGLPLLLLAGLAVALRRDRWTWCFVTMAVLATLVALGKHGFLYRLLYELLPGFKKFRVPVMILVLQEIAVVVLAARGLDLLVAALRAPPDARPRWLGRPVLVAVLALGLVLVVLGSMGSGSLREAAFQRWQGMAASFGRGAPPLSALRAAADLAASDALRLGAILLASTLALLATARGRVPASAAVAVVGSLLVVDLWRVDQPLLHPEKHLVRLARQGERVVTVPSESLVRDASTLQEYVEELEVTRWLSQEAERPRVWPLGEWGQDNRIAAREVVSLGGYHAAKLKVYEDLRGRLYDPARPAVRGANLMGARWVLAPGPLGEATLEGLRTLGLDLEPEARWSGREGVLYESRSALPEAWMVGAFEEEDSGRDLTGQEPATTVLERVLSPQFDPRRRVILSAAPAVSPGPQTEEADVQVLHRGYNALRYRVLTSTPGILVMNEVWYPEWRVRVNGEPARLLRANHLQRAVALEAGEHEIEVWYGARSYTQGLWSSRLSALVILIGLLEGPLRRRLRRGRSDGGAPA
jgi:hypothetical protein